MISACARATRWSDAVGHLSSLMNTLDTPTTPGQGNSDSNLDDDDDGRSEIGNSLRQSVQQFLDGFHPAIWDCLQSLRRGAALSQSGRVL